LDALACASIAVEACWSIWFFVSSVVSLAKSVSSMLPCAADRFEEMLVILGIQIVVYHGVNLKQSMRVLPHVFLVNKFC